MKHSVPESMKFKKLQRRLGVTRVVTAGTLELLWITTQKNAKRGDIGRFTNEEIAIECDWEGDPDDLISAMVETGWLDTSTEHRLVVHDWKDHCPAYLKSAVNQTGGFILGDPIDPPYSPPLETHPIDPASTPPLLHPPLRNVTKPNVTKPKSFVDLQSTDGETRPDQVVDFWNSEATPPTSKIQKLTTDRRRKLQARLADPDWPWQEAIQRLPIPNDDRFTWQPDFDWLIANATNAVKIVEGKYHQSDKGQRIRENIHLLERQS